MHILERNSLEVTELTQFYCKRETLFGNVAIELFLLLGKGMLEAKPRLSWNHSHMKPALVL